MRKASRFALLLWTAEATTKPKIIATDVSAKPDATLPKIRARIDATPSQNDAMKASIRGKRHCPVVPSDSRTPVAKPSRRNVHQKPPHGRS